VLQVTKVLKEDRELKELQGLKEPQVTKVLKEVRELKVLLVLKE
jgi:hypothetical protein